MTIDQPVPSAFERSTESVPSTTQNAMLEARSAARCRPRQRVPRRRGCCSGTTPSRRSRARLRAAPSPRGRASRDGCATSVLGLGVRPGGEQRVAARPAAPSTRCADSERRLERLSSTRRRRVRRGASASRATSARATASRAASSRSKSGSSSPPSSRAALARSAAAAAASASASSAQRDVERERLGRAVRGSDRSQSSSSGSDASAAVGPVGPVGRCCVPRKRRPRPSTASRARRASSAELFALPVQQVGDGAERAGGIVLEVGAAARRPEEHDARRSPAPHARPQPSSRSGNRGVRCRDRHRQDEREDRSGRRRRRSSR